MLFGHFADPLFSPPPSFRSISIDRTPMASTVGTAFTISAGPRRFVQNLIEGAMVGYTPGGMQLAQESLRILLNANMGSDLLLAAAGEKTGGCTTANYVWDLLQSCKITPSLPAVKAYHEGLKEREIPSDDPRLVLIGRPYDNLNVRFGGRRNV